MTSERQRIVRVAGSRRAKLTPAPGTTTEPEVEGVEALPDGAASESGPNDERMMREVPPHY